MESLAVHLCGTHVADITRGRAPNRLHWSWTPLAADRWGLGARVVSHGFAIGQPVHDLLVGAFVEGLLPEGAARIHYAVNAGIEPGDLFALLDRYGWDTPGALVIGPDPAGLASSAGYVSIRLNDSDVRSLLDKADSSNAGGTTSPILPGFVPKIALSRADDGTWLLPPAGVPSTWILKVAHPADSVAADVVDTEALCLDLGRRIGVTTVQASVLDFDGRRAIAVSRYDRVLVDGRVQRIHEEDLAQVFGLNTADPARKFQRGRTLPSWREGARALGQDGGRIGPMARLVTF
ncbi:hypothetical protein KILIM_030_00440 [Kineosphaera limosa NBRC 100340]|uniref:HipA N-terminal subdomain 1 domain-containing protein n=1 Tax=Kineosphaera limosa NBRC 100340 TaxID=1184609 RepID=K6WQA3_9MICO|nr:hypothetical protein KILIM_030_00440 [Kineosphaera limosa NBRC 100340]